MDLIHSANRFFCRMTQQFFIQINATGLVAVNSELVLLKNKSICKKISCIQITNNHTNIDKVHGNSQLFITHKFIQKQLYRAGSQKQNNNFQAFILTSRKKRVLLHLSRFFQTLISYCKILFILHSLLQLILHILYHTQISLLELKKLKIIRKLTQLNQFKYI